MGLDGYIKDSLRLALRNRKLWIFGFFVNVSLGVGLRLPPGSEKAGDASLAQVGSLLLRPPGSQFWPLLVILPVLIFLACVSSAALIETVGRNRTYSQSSMMTLWVEGKRCYGKIFAISALLYVIVWGFLLLEIALLSFVSGLINIPGLNLLLAAVFLLIPFLFLAVAAIIVGNYARRACVLEGRGVFDSLIEGVRLARRTFTRTLTVWLVDIGLSLFAIFISLYIIGCLIIGFAVLGLAWHPGIAQILGIFALLIASFSLVAVKGTFSSAYWTHAYLDLQEIR